MQAEFNFFEPKIMGILNLTPDSFFDGNRYVDEKSILNRVGAMLEQGADIIDIGAFSSRPGANFVSLEEERRRLLPNLKAIVKHFPKTIISIDTYRSKIAKEVIEEGATIINDISAGNLDPKMFQTIADLQVPYIMMHMQGTPKNMQNNPEYTNIVEDIKQFFTDKIAKLSKLGFHNCIIDPGFGFGKTLAHNYEILHNIDAFLPLKKPILVGLSRKSMLYKLLDTSPDEVLNATTIANTIAMVRGANMLRVHDVKEAVEILKILQYADKK